jgi:histone H3/H4
LTKAHEELFKRSGDETFPSLDGLWRFCQSTRDSSSDHWRPPASLNPVGNGNLKLDLGSGSAPYSMNDWSFSQLCGFAGASKETLNRLTPDTASRALNELLPRGNKPLQLYVDDQDRMVRSIHGTTYTRLHNADLVSMLMEFATDFQPPQRARGGGTGLYCGEQDLFAFLIDPTGWAEIDDQPFAPGFFVWNSEVGKRSVGISTFWFQAICENHIVWDATEVVEFTRKHTGKVGEALGDIRRIVEALVEKRDVRRDGFVSLMKKAMETKLGDDAEEVIKALTKNGIGKGLAKRALEIAEAKGRFTIFALVDALTRLAGESEFAGDRTAADEKAAGLLALAA